MAKLKLWGLVKVLKQGYSLQVTIPKEIAGELDINPGDKLKVEYSEKRREIVYSID